MFSPVGLRVPIYFFFVGDPAGFFLYIFAACYFSRRSAARSFVVGLLSP